MKAEEIRKEAERQIYAAIEELRKEGIVVSPPLNITVETFPPES